MATELPCTINDRFMGTFLLDDDGNVQIRTTAVGSFSISGLSEAIKITTADIGDTATALPVTALTNRNSISIENKSTTETLYIGNATVTADTVNGVTSGWELPPESILNFDITEAITIYGIAETGKTIKVKLLEMA